MTRQTPLAPMLVSIVVASSCGDGQGPGSVAFDTAQASAALETARGVLMSPALGAHLSLAPRFITPDVAPTGEAQSEAPAFRRIGVLPPEHLGTTFVFDEELGEYVPSEEAGAPANALRFVLYDTDADGAPIATTVMGHADLTDEGVELENGFAVRVQATAGGVTFADYTASFVAEGSTNEISVDVARLDHVGLDIAGVIRSSTEEIDIDLVTGTVNGILATEFQVTSGTVTTTGEISEDEESGSRSFQGELRLSQDNLTVSASGTAHAFTAEIAVNGTDWATVDVQQGTVTVVAAGDALGTTEESIALRLAEYFLMVPHLARGMVVGALYQ